MNFLVKLNNKSHMIEIGSVEAPTGYNVLLWKLPCPLFSWQDQFQFNSLIRNISSSSHSVSDISGETS